MNTDKLKNTIDSIIANTFSRLENVYNNHKEGFDSDLPPTRERQSRLVFPAYYYDENGEKRIKSTRISEQELRFAFIEEFNYYCNENEINLFYSVETPTKDTYSDFSTNPIPNPHGRSGEFDMVIYDENLKRVCLIEFKANNADEVDHEKDFLKLKNEEKDDVNVLRYFIEIVKSYRNDTIESLKGKFRFKGKLTEIRCFALEGKSRRNIKNESEDISRMFN